MQHIESHQFMRSSHQDFNSEQERLVNRYVEEKDDEFERLLKDEDELHVQHNNMMMTP